MILLAPFAVSCSKNGGCFSPSNSHNVSPLDCWDVERPSNSTLRVEVGEILLVDLGPTG